MKKTPEGEPLIAVILKGKSADKVSQDTVRSKKPILVTEAGWSLVNLGKPQPKETSERTLGSIITIAKKEYRSTAHPETSVTQNNGTTLFERAVHGIKDSFFKHALEDE